MIQLNVNNKLIINYQCDHSCSVPSPVAVSVIVNPVVSSSLYSSS